MNLISEFVKEEDWFGLPLILWSDTFPDLTFRNYFPIFQYGSWKRKVIFKHPKSLKLRQLAPPSLIIMLLISVILFALLNAWYLVPSLAYFLICIAVSTFQKGLSST